MQRKRDKKVKKYENEKKIIEKNNIIEKYKNDITGIELRKKDNIL
jgi:hypothetical protein